MPLTGRKAPWLLGCGRSRRAHRTAHRGLIAALIEPFVAQLLAEERLVALRLICDNQSRKALLIRGAGAPAGPLHEEATNV